MARNANIPIYNKYKEFQFFASFRDAKLMIANGQAVPMTSQLTGEVPGWEEREDFQIPAVMMSYRAEKHDNAFISANESEANAGAHVDLLAIKRARQKVKMWPYVHDEKAVYVSPRV